MNIEELREYLLSLPDVKEVEPFPDILVYKIAGKWFAVIMLERNDTVAVKCEPERAEALRAQYDTITPAWHFNKRHWNDLRFTALDADIVRREIRHSYLTVIRRNVTPVSLRRTLLAAAEHLIDP